eukprot:gene4268-20464_t
MKSAGARAGARQNQNSEAYQAYFDEKFAELKKEMATKKCIDHLHAPIKKQNDKIEMLESKIVMMERHIAQLQNNLDDNEQINGLPPVAEGESETSEMCLEKVKNVFKELEVDVPDAVIDRAHRIGSPRNVKGKKIHQVIVRFTTWRHRTLVYRARKKCPKYSIKLDSTKRRIDIIQKVTSFLKEKELGFAFADVNCRLSVKIGDVFEHFNSEEDLMDIVRRYDEKSESESHPKQSNDATADNDFTGDDAAAETTAVSES